MVQFDLGHTLRPVMLSGDILFVFRPLITCAKEVLYIVGGYFERFGKKQQRQKDDCK